MMADRDTRQKIAAELAELYAALEWLGADGTMTDKEVLRLLEEYNRTGTALRQME